jgi:hypothetical protein
MTHQTQTRDFEQSLKHYQKVRKHFLFSFGLLVITVILLLTSFVSTVFGAPSEPSREVSPIYPNSRKPASESLQKSNTANSSKNLNKPESAKNLSPNGATSKKQMKGTSAQKVSSNNLRANGNSLKKSETGGITVHANQVVINQSPVASGSASASLVTTSNKKTQKQAGTIESKYANTVTETPNTVLTAAADYDLTRSDLASPVSTTTSLPKKNDSKIQRLSGSWNLYTASAQVKDEVSKKTYSELSLGIKADYYANSFLRLSFWPSFYSENGNAQNRSQEEANSSSFSVKQAGAFAELAGYGTLGFGALNQRAFANKLLIKNAAFPALSAKINSKKDENTSAQVGVSVVSAIPTSVNLATQNNTFEKTPSFATAKLFMNLETKLFEGSISSGYWEYKNLPSKTAESSAPNGNSVIATNDKVSNFVHEYKGYFGDASATLHVSDIFDFGASVNAVINNSAPTNNKFGYQTRSFATLKFNDDFSAGPFYEFFRIEPDAVVAAYGTSNLMPNTTGYKTGLEMTISKAFNLSINGGEQIALYETPSQTRQLVFEISLETTDVPF